MGYGVHHGPTGKDKSRISHFQQKQKSSKQINSFKDGTEKGATMPRAFVESGRFIYSAKEVLEWT